MASKQTTQRRAEEHREGCRSGQEEDNRASSEISANGAGCKQATKVAKRNRKAA